MEKQKIDRKRQKIFVFSLKNIKNACYGRRPVTGVGLLRALTCFGRRPATRVCLQWAFVCNERVFALNVCYERLLRASATSVEERTGNVRRKCKKKNQGDWQAGLKKEWKENWKRSEKVVKTGGVEEGTGGKEWSKGVEERNGKLEWNHSFRKEWKREWKKKVDKQDSR